MARMHYGVHALLEAEADALIKLSMRGQTKPSEKSDVLTPWKQDHRRKHEVYPNSGVADPSIRRGMFDRAANDVSTHLNSIDGHAPTLGGGVVHAQGQPDRTFGLAAFIERELAGEENR